MHPIGRFMIACSALPLVAPVFPGAAPLLVGSWAALHAAFLWSLLRPGGSTYAPNVSRGDPRTCAMILTFDDGPRGDETRALLDVLGAEGIRATFFVVGRRAAADPGVVRRIVGDGHTLGNHTQTHPPGWAAAGRARVLDEVAQAQETLAGITGRAPAWFRPPMGHKNVYLREALAANDLRMVTWSLRSWDTVIRRPDAVARRILARSGGGEIVLLHEGLASDGGPMAPRIVRALARGLEERRLRPVGLLELLGAPPEDREEHRTQGLRERPASSSDAPAR